MRDDATGDGLTTSERRFHWHAKRYMFGLVREALDAVDVGANPVRHVYFGWRVS